MADNLASMAAKVLDEIQQVFKAGSDKAASDLVDEIIRANERRIVLHGVGREGLMMRAFTMRLYHLGLNAHCLGDMTCPPIDSRDEGPGITVCTREGLNRLTMSAYDARPFCLEVRIIRHLSLEQVMELIPSEKDGEPFEEAMARVRRCINGGGGQVGGDDDGSDSDLEVVAESITVNLRCPMSGSRIKVAGRFKPCLHMGCFDLDTYVELNQRARKEYSDGPMSEFFDYLLMRLKEKKTSCTCRIFQNIL